MTPTRDGRRKQRGGIDELPSGALRVRVYAGKDPVSGKRHDLVEVIPPGPKAMSLAEAARTRFLNQVDEQRNPRTSATLDKLLDRYLATLQVSRTTHRAYRRYLEKHVRPFVGHLKAGAVDADALDSLYAELRRCRAHCTTPGGIDHRTPRDHRCDERCRPHKCKPLAAATIRHIHFVLNGAYKKAIRWRWVSTNPVMLAEPPSATAPDPRPPSAEEAARLVQEAWRDPDWGTLVWLTMTTGARRGELCALRWSHVDLATGTVTYRRGIAQDGTFRWEKDTKTHQQRRLAIDRETVDVLAEYWDRCRSRAASLGLVLGPEAFVFSLAPDGSTHLVPGSVSQRYSRLAKRLGIETNLHSLRHYSATELIAAGVDVRTVAGRLGHSGGGITTLRVYAAWVSEADQRASASLLARMPRRPDSVPEPSERAKTDPQTPREVLAAELRKLILTGSIPAGGYLPSMKQLAADHDIAVSTVHRAITLLKDWGLVEGERGQRVKVAAVVAVEPAEAVGSGEHTEERAADGASPGRVGSRQLLNLEIRWKGEMVGKLTAEANAQSGDELRQLLLDAIRRGGRDETGIADYEMDVRHAGENDLLMTFVAALRR